ncbi:MAG: ABC transporter substrate-binding protein [Lachnospiraceae bacterium]|nr:ABC transporter substrate-binding protein [Lachnospiraceae bacterium]
MKKVSLKRLFGLILAMAMVFSAVGCSSSGTKDLSGETSGTQTGNNNIVNIAITDPVGTINPLLMDATEIVKYSSALQFLPLCELNSDLEFEPMLASSITTEDNIHFIVKIDENANWSDGTPVTADDLVFTVLRYASPLLANTSMLLYAFEGVGDDGWVEEGATEISGVVALDEKTVQFTAKYPMSLTTFQNSYGRYILTVPKHILGDVPEAELASYEWFNAPTAVNGPYKLESYDLNHYLSYTANESYFKGAPKIEKLNIRVVAASQLLTGLTTGEIDFLPPTMAAVLQEDYEAIQNLAGVTASFGKPVTHQAMYINSERVDKRIRQAILCAIDREMIVSQLLGGAGEVVDGFLSTASPFYSEDVVPVSYDPEKAKDLVAQAVADGWDADKELILNINSGDTTFNNIAAVIQQQLNDVGIKTKITPMDLSSLLTAAGSHECDMFVVQYSYAPVDPYPDASWILTADGWTQYQNDAVDNALAQTQLTSDIAEIADCYEIVDLAVQEDVPLISLYVIRALGAVSSRLVNATPDAYGSFNNVHLWEIAK